MWPLIGGIIYWDRAAYNKANNAKLLGAQYGDGNFANDLLGFINGNLILNLSYAWKDRRYAINKLLQRLKAVLPNWPNLRKKYILFATSKTCMQGTLNDNSWWAQDQIQMKPTFWNSVTTPETWLVIFLLSSVAISIMVSFHDGYKTSRAFVAITLAVCLSYTGMASRCLLTIC